jgi:hypothetical protein
MLATRLKNTSNSSTTTNRPLCLNSTLVIPAFPPIEIISNIRRLFALREFGWGDDACARNAGGVEGAVAVGVGSSGTESSGQRDGPCSSYKEGYSELQPSDRA